MGLSVVFSIAAGLDGTASSRGPRYMTGTWGRPRILRPPFRGIARERLGAIARGSR